MAAVLFGRGPVVKPCVDSGFVPRCCNNLDVNVQPSADCFGLGRSSFVILVLGCIVDLLV